MNSWSIETNKNFHNECIGNLLEGLRGRSKSDAGIIDESHVVGKITVCKFPAVSYKIVFLLRYKMIINFFSRGMILSKWLMIITRIINRSSVQRGTLFWPPLFPTYSPLSIYCYSVVFYWAIFFRKTKQLFSITCMKRFFQNVKRPFISSENTRALFLHRRKWNSFPLYFL